MPDKFSYVKKGYDPTAVDLYVDELEEEIRGYKHKDDAIRNAIISAQMAADNIVSNAKNQGRAIRENSILQLKEISAAVASQKKVLQNFLEEYSAIMSKYLKPMENPDFISLNQKIENLEKYLSSFSEEINEDMAISENQAENNK